MGAQQLPGVGVDVLDFQPIHGSLLCGGSAVPGDVLIVCLLCGSPAVLGEVRVGSLLSLFFLSLLFLPIFFVRLVLGLVVEGDAAEEQVGEEVGAALLVGARILRAQASGGGGE